jgi:NAD(P)-dependent dehydrogenase (short-subunit alcohol dehydrogenase family)
MVNRRSDPMHVLVAGAGGGIGSACIERLERDGHRVVGVDREGVDITRPGGADEAVAEAERRLGALTAVVHAVGMSGRRLGDGPPSACTDEAWAEVLRVNLESAFRLLRAAFPAFRRAGDGSFVAVGSVLAEHADEDFLTAAYAVSKTGLRALVRTAALEGAAEGIRVNLVEPGLVDTTMARRAIGDERIAARLRGLQPLGGEAVSAAAVAEAVCWVLSPAAGRTTGAYLPVDGGWTVR